MNKTAVWDPVCWSRVRALCGLRVGPAPPPPPGRQLCAREYLRPRGALSAACSEGSDALFESRMTTGSVALVAMACAVPKRARAEIRR